jgi:MFS family permease
MSQSDVGLMISASSLLTLIVLGSTVVFLLKIGNYRTAVYATAINFLSTLGLAYVNDIGWIFVFFVIHAILTPVTLFCFDVFLESYTEDESSTGSVRGIFLSISIFGALFSPVISGWVVGDESIYERAYLIGALYLLPVLILLAIRFRSFADPHYTVLSVKKMFRTLSNNKNIRNVSMAQLLLRLFFSWMVVFMPMYLHQNIGFSWFEIGIVFFVMLFAYLFIEYPAAILADKYYGEKELMFTGFVIMGLSTISLIYIHTTSLIVWSAVLFVTRIGAALVESMTETYFFKQIQGDDASILSIFRMLRPLAYTIGPFVGGMLLIFIDIAYLWPILGVITLIGTFNARALVDTK